METSTALQKKQPKARPVRWQFYLAALLAVGFLIYFFQPGVTTWWFRRHLVSRALESNANVTFDKLEADFFGGHILLGGIDLTDRQHAENHLHSAEIEVNFSPWRLIFQGDLSPITKVSVGKTDLDWKWQPEKADKTEKKGKSKTTFTSTFRNRFPDAFVGNGISANLECGAAKVTFSNVDFNFVPNTAGEIDIPHMSASLPPWHRTFNNLEGVTAIKERALYVGGLKFSPDLVLERGALDFTHPEKQKMTSDLLFSAFGGQWRTDIDLVRRRSPIEIDAAASFWNLSVKQLGEFVGNRELAEGLIHEGRITFQGDPGEPTRSNSTLRLNATGFRWHERQWDSLVASALLVNRRIEIPQFDLVQSKNQIQLKGSSEIPAKWSQLPAEFQLQVLAQIDDLHSAALLVFPGQKGIEGEAFFAGEVRNENGKFSGNLKMRGGPLEISGVAVDRVRGDLNLRGSEVSATALEFARRDDKASGWATLDLAQPRRYSGEFEVTAADIADYGAILPKAIAEHAAAGGAKLWWSGDGTNHAHSGAFKVNLSDFLVSHNNNAVPLDVETHGSYSPAGITLNHLSLQRPNAKLDAAIVVLPESMELRDLRMTGSGGATISGNITLPINLLSAANNPTLAALLDSRASATGQIKGNDVRLDEICELAGVHQPVRGRAQFELTASGPIEKLALNLQLGLKDFFGPEKLNIPSLKGTIQLAENQLTVHADISPDEVRDSLSIQVETKTALSQATLIQGQWLDSAAPLTGSLSAKRLAIPQLHPWWPATRAFSGDASGDFHLEGTPERPVFTGSIVLQNTSWQPDWLTYPLQKLNGTLTLATSDLSTEKITGAYRGGSFSVIGKSGFTPQDYLDLTIEGKNLTFSAPPDPSEALVGGSVHLIGAAAARLVEGSVQIQNAVLWRELTVSDLPVDLPAVSRFSLPWVPADWQVRLEVTAAQPFEIRDENATWLADPQIVFRGTARTPSLMGRLLLRPFALTQNATTESGETRVYFDNSMLENGVVEGPEAGLSAEISPASVEQTATPEPTPTPAPRRLEISPRPPQSVSASSH